MPFANKFMAMMDLPFPGDQLGSMLVESIDVGHEGRTAGYGYPMRLVLRGAGGLPEVKRSIKALFRQRCTTFSGFGTPYQLWFGKPTVESLGADRYLVTAEGAGVPVHLKPDLERFCDHLAAVGALSATDEQRGELIESFIKRYQAQVASIVGKYHRRLEKRKRSATGPSGDELIDG